MYQDREKALFQAFAVPRKRQRYVELLSTKGGRGTFISCVSGVLAYFEGEEPAERYICHRTQ